MLPADTLSIWADACAAADIPWYLSRENLLCAVGYHHFPGSLKYARVMVFSKDLPILFKTVLPSLPSSWLLSQTKFTTKDRELCLEEEGVPVLLIDVLCPVESPEQKQCFASQVKKLRKLTNRTANYQKYFDALLGSGIGRLYKKLTDRRFSKTFDSLLTFVQSLPQALPFYCDSLTCKNSVLLDKSLFHETVNIVCQEGSYPVFSGYATYLTLVYGDYEAGLTDSIGVGLTAEEKQALQLHQQHCHQALSFVQQVSQEFNLRYCLLAGSVLGPVRHGGFIPWDDDIDIGIRIEDLERFEQVIAEQLPLRLPAEFSLKQSGPDNPYPRMFSKICYEGRCCMDLWPLIPTYIDGFKAEWTWYFAKVITKAHYYKIGHRVTRFLKVVKPLCLLLSDKQIMALARRNERRHCGKQAPAYINIYSVYKRPKETILRQWLDTPATADFSGITVPIVGCTEDYLTHMYGDYMQYPAPWSRASRHYERF